MDVFLMKETQRYYLFDSLMKHIQPEADFFISNLGNYA